MLRVRKIQFGRGHPENLLREDVVGIFIEVWSPKYIWSGGKTMMFSVYLDYPIEEEKATAKEVSYAIGLPLESAQALTEAVKVRRIIITQLETKVKEEIKKQTEFAVQFLKKYGIPRKKLPEIF